MTLLAPSALFGLTAVPLLIALYVTVAVRRGRTRPAAFSLATGDMPTTASGPRRRHVPFALLLISVTLLIFSLARPEANVTLPVRTGKVILTFDTSNSMAATDDEPTRLEVAKQTARSFVDKQPGSVQIGVVAFTNGGVVVQQPTKNQNDVNAAIDRLATDGSTSISEGIFAALTAISPTQIEVDPEVVAVDIADLEIGSFSNAAIIVFTDGENEAGADPFELARLSANAGVPIYTVGMGTPAGTTVELDGFAVATALDEAMLTEIASLTGGEYFLADNDPELTGIFDAIDRTFERQGERIEVTALVSMLALVFLVLAGGLSMRWFGRAV